MSFRTIPEMFFKVCTKNPDKNLFLHKKNGKYNGVKYSEIEESINNLSLGLLELGIRKGDRVAIASENRVEWFISSMSVLSIGAVVVPIFPSLTSKQVEYIFSDCQTTAAIVSNKLQLNKVMEFKDSLYSLRHVLVINDDFTSEDFAVKSFNEISLRGNELRAKEARCHQFQEIRNKIEPDDIGTIIYTSGTTGNPKGVMLTHKNTISNISGSIEVINLRESDLLFSYLPWCHAFEYTTGLLCSIYVGATIAIADSIESVGLNLQETNPTFLTTVPRLLEMIMKRIKAANEKLPASKKKIFDWAVSTGRKYVYASQAGRVSIALKAKHKLADKLVYSKIREKTGSRLRTIVSGGAPLSVDVAEFFMAAGFILLEGYGLTEASPVVSVNREDSVEIGTIGKPLSNLTAKISEEGELLVQGPSIMKGYWNDPASTNDAIDHEGWLYTGDIVVITDKGNIKITDRKKNIFVNTGGKNIAPQPIENVLSQSPFIEQVILLGDNREFVTALITPDFNQLKVLAESLGVQYENMDELTYHPQIVKVIKNDIDRLQKDFAKYERVRKFRLLSQPFSIESGELTPKLSIKRHVVERNYSVLINEMYNVS